MKTIVIFITILFINASCKHEGYHEIEYEKPIEGAKLEVDSIKYTEVLMLVDDYGDMYVYDGIGIKHVRIDTVQDDLILFFLSWLAGMLFCLAIIKFAKG